jgi:hypothetical protein
VTAALVATAFTAVGANAAGPVCRTMGPSSGAFTATLCLTAPAAGATVSADTAVQATIAVTPSRAVRYLRFSVDGATILTDYWAPYTFTLEPERWADGAHRLDVRATVKNGSGTWTSGATGMGLTFAAGGPVPPGSGFEPRTGTMPPLGEPFVVAAVGDGADGGPNAAAVVSLLSAMNPSMVLYLGDVYEDGTPTEFSNWYGEGVSWGAFAPITNPTVGNHEYDLDPTAGGYFGYWDGPPHAYAVDVAGWHVVSIDSTEEYAQVAPGTAQFEWLRNDLETDGSDCTLVFFHHPPFSSGLRAGDVRLAALWRLLADRGVDIVLNGHAHNYQRWVPMGADGTPDPAGPTAFVVGTGGKSRYAIDRTTPGLAAGSDTADGTLRLALRSDGADFAFLATPSPGTVLDQGSVTCSRADRTPPTPPGDLQAPSVAENAVELTWSASTDDTGVAGYRVARDGVQVGSVDAGSLSFVDGSVRPGRAYRYTVRAFDEAGNVSDPGGPLDVTTPPSSDITPPSAVTDLWATSPDPYTVQLSWGAAIDDVGVDGYLVTRGGVEVASLGPSATGWTDAGRAPGSSAAYEVVASDFAGNTSDPVSVVGSTRALVFADGFETGSAAAWTTTRAFTVTDVNPAVGAWAGRASTTGATASFAVANLTGSAPTMWMRTSFRVGSRTTTAILLRARRTDGTGLVNLQLTSAGALALRDEIGSTTTTSGLKPAGGVWHRLTLRLTVNGTASSTAVWLDGAQVTALSKTVSLGTMLPGRLQIGDHLANRVFTIDLDEAAADTAPFPIP